MGGRELHFASLSYNGDDTIIQAIQSGRELPYHSSVALFFLQSFFFSFLFSLFEKSNRKTFFYFVNYFNVDFALS